MDGRWEQNAKNNANVNLVNFESAHGREASPTPAPHYNPDKAMREAEREYLKSKGWEQKTLFRKIAEFFRGEKE